MSTTKDFDDAVTIVSSPGKVLLTGGYLVTQRPNRGLVLTVNARCYCVVQSQKLLDVLPDTRITAPRLEIRVVSPQFKDSERTYTFNLSHSPATPTQSTPPSATLTPSHSNPFVEIPLLYTLAVITAHPRASKRRQQLLDLNTGNVLRVVILADNAFYSQHEHLKGDTKMGSLRKFIPLSATLENMKKTGLGSSATLVTSLCSSLLLHFGVLNFSEPKDVDFAHQLSQYCHSLAQNSIGSGFDVGAAVYGSHLYSRFSPSLLRLPQLVEARKGVADVAGLLAILRTPWDHTHEKLSLPRGWTLMLGDINEGSKTPGMVKKVTEWRDGVQKAGHIEASPWGRLVRRNAEFATLFRQMALISSSTESKTDRHHNADFKHALEIVAKSPNSKWMGEVSNNWALMKMSKLRSLFLDIRADLREMGRLAGDGSDSFIEPKEQADLANETMNVQGVLLSGVPGAGGKDAIFAIVIGEENISKVEDLWHRKGVVSLGIEEDSTGLKSHKSTKIIPEDVREKYLLQKSASAVVAPTAKL